MKQYASAIITATVASFAAVFLARWYTGLYEAMHKAMAVYGTSFAIEFASKLFLSILLGGALTLVGCVLYFKRLKATYAVCVYVSTLLLTCVDVFCILRFRMCISWYLIEVIVDTADTNFGEAMGFFENFIGFNEITMLAATVVFGVLIWRSKGIISRLAVKYYKTSISLVLALGIVSQLYSGGLIWVGNDKALPVYGLYKAVDLYLLHRRCLAKLNREKTNTQKICEVSDNLPEYVFFMLGESENRHYMGIYGSPYDSTPFMQKLVNSNNLFVFKDVISPQGMTNLVLPRIFCFINNETIYRDIAKYGKSLEESVCVFKGAVSKKGIKADEDIDMSFPPFLGFDVNAHAAFNDEGNANKFLENAALISGGKISSNDISMYDTIIDILNKCGYQSFWVTNNLFGISFTNFLRGACTYSFMPYKSMTLCEEPKTDDCVLPALDGFLSKEALNSSKNFFVIHIYGSHFVYKQRYPNAFCKFNSKDITQKGFNEAQKQTIAEYINSVLFTDYIQNEVIKRIKDKDAVLIYISDHAEELYVPTGQCGHRAENLSKAVVEIPMFIYLSDTYKQKRPQIVKQIKNALNRPYMTDDLIHTLCDLIGVKTPCCDFSRSVINSGFITRARKINGKNYEDLL